MLHRWVLRVGSIPLLACGAGGGAAGWTDMSQGGTAGGTLAGGTAGASSTGGDGTLTQAGTATQEGGRAPAGGSSPDGGLAGDAGSGGAGGAADPQFKLLWRDDFDSFDDDRWVKATHTFDENAAHFVPDNVVVEGGLLKLKVTQVASGNKQYSAAEVYSSKDFTFGRFEGRIRFCAGSGLVSSLFTYRDDVEVSWQEIDVEHLGNLPNSIQYNLISGTFASRQYQPKVVTFPYSPTAEFHDYTIEWLPDGITFYVDGVQSHHDVQATLQDSAKLRMNAWPTNNQITSFAGPLDTNAIPCEAEYEWVQVFAYTP
jgi:beta-glucanase (GH16 family)